MRPPLRRAAALAFLATVLPGCNQEYGNPFAGGNSSVRLPANADVLFASNLHGANADTPREIFAIEDTGANVTQITTCAPGGAPCDTLEAVSAPDRLRLAVRRGGGEDTALLLVDLARRVEGGLLDTNSRVSAIDWSSQEVLVYSALGASGLEDLYRMDPNGQNNRNLSSTPAVRERRPRIDPSGTQAVYERIEASTGRGEVWIFISGLTQARVTTGGERGAAMAGTPYVEGSDADPDFSPDGRAVVFRRLRRATADRQGEWDLMAANVDGSGLRTLVSGPSWRGAPDWGSSGIVFPEGEGTQRRLVVVNPQGADRRVLLTVSARTLDFPRWLP